jgi:hypothetical protein
MMPMLNIEVRRYSFVCHARTEFVFSKVFQNEPPPIDVPRKRNITSKKFFFLLKYQDIVNELGIHYTSYKLERFLLGNKRNVVWTSFLIPDFVQPLQNCYFSLFAISECQTHIPVPSRPSFVCNFSHHVDNLRLLISVSLKLTVFGCTLS